MVDKPQPLDSRKAVFVGGVPRPLKASELAHVMEEKYGNVTFVGIDCDNDLKYPKGEQTGREGSWQNGHIYPIVVW